MTCPIPTFRERSRNAGDHDEDVSRRTLGGKQQKLALSDLGDLLTRG